MRKLITMDKYTGNFFFSFFSFYKNIIIKIKTLYFNLSKFFNFWIFNFFLFNSNPFSKIYPIPIEGLGLNPILQDPALAIHPPLLYVGFVGSSNIFFSRYRVIDK